MLNVFFAKTFPIHHCCHQFSERMVFDIKSRQALDLCLFSAEWHLFLKITQLSSITYLEQINFKQETCNRISVLKFAMSVHIINLGWDCILLLICTEIL